MLHERETDLLRFTMDKRGPFYHINGYGRSSKRAPWKHVWIEHVHISYLKALNEFNDTGALLFAFTNQLNVTAA